MKIQCNRCKEIIYEGNNPEGWKDVADDHILARHPHDPNKVFVCTFSRVLWYNTLEEGKW